MGFFLIIIALYIFMFFTFGIRVAGPAILAKPGLGKLFFVCLIASVVFTATIGPKTWMALSQVISAIMPYGASFEMLGSIILLPPLMSLAGCLLVRLCAKDFFISVGKKELFATLLCSVTLGIVFGLGLVKFG